MVHAVVIDSLARDRVKAAKKAEDKRNDEKKKREDKIAVDNEKREHAKNAKKSTQPAQVDK
jgi:hypothetical protein